MVVLCILRVFSFSSLIAKLVAWVNGCVIQWKFMLFVEAITSLVHCTSSCTPSGELPVLPVGLVLVFAFTAIPKAIIATIRNNTFFNQTKISYLWVKLYNLQMWFPGPIFGYRFLCQIIYKKSITKKTIRVNRYFILYLQA